MRTLNSNFWPELLPLVVDNLNSLPHKAIGGLAPENISSARDDPKVDKAKLAAKKSTILSEPTPETHFNDWTDNQKNYEKSNAELKKGCYVYVGFAKDPMFRSKDFQVTLKVLVSFYMN